MLPENNSFTGNEKKILPENNFKNTGGNIFFYRAVNLLPIKKLKRKYIQCMYINGVL